MSYNADGKMDEFEQELTARYPWLFEGHAECGFSCPDGWRDIVSRLCADLEVMRDTFEINFWCDQVKEKFAGLRFYISTLWPTGLSEDAELTDEQKAHLHEAFEAVHARIGEAEAEAERTCEDCGQPGVMRRGRWLHTLCDEHADGAEPTSM